MNFLKRQSGSCVDVNGGREISQICVPKMNKNLTGLEQHEDQFLGELTL